MTISRRAVAMLATAAATAALLIATPAGALAQPVDTRPTAVVALGDSAASGEGAGDYEEGTRGEDGNWCHRSRHAYVHRTGLADTSINLACSGAESAQVGLGSATQYGEGSQAQRLIQVATEHRVTVVTLQTGGNDEVALIGTGIACIRAALDPREPLCRDTVGPQWPERTAATAQRVAATVTDVREAMRQAGYADQDYTLILAGYASPVTEKMVPAHGARGCPYARDDAAWARTVAFPELSGALRGVAQDAGVAFLDLTRATEGYEACTRTPWTEEWQRRITVDAQALVYGGLSAIGYHLAQESFHPNATGHAEIGRCLGDFVRSGAAEGACVVGADGRLWVENAVPAPV